jgi:hypothetical protein
MVLAGCCAVAFGRLASWRFRVAKQHGHSVEVILRM